MGGLLSLVVSTCIGIRLVVPAGHHTVSTGSYAGPLRYPHSCPQLWGERLMAWRFLCETGTIAGCRHMG